MKKVLLYGAGGHAKVVLECLQAQGIETPGIFDDNPQRQGFAGVPVLGSYYNGMYPQAGLIISIGNNGVRYKLANQISHLLELAVHPSALVSPTAVLRPGTVVFHRAVVQAAALVGKHVIINTGAIVEHDTILSDFVHIGPGAVVCGGVKVGNGSLVGAGAVVLPGVTIGRWCSIGAGAVVTRSVPDFSVAVGNPAGVIKRTNEA